jgi:hypothetical protein
MSLANKKIVGGGFENREQLVVVEYDFDNDTGAAADYDVLEADGSCVVELKRIDVETACTSGGSMVMDLGKGDGGTEFKSDLAVASLSLDAQIAADTVGTMVELADGEKIAMGIEVAALTAGKFKMVFAVYPR